MDDLGVPLFSETPIYQNTLDLQHVRFGCFYLLYDFWLWTHIRRCNNARKVDYYMVFWMVLVPFFLQYTMLGLHHSKQHRLRLKKCLRFILIFKQSTIQELFYPSKPLRKPHAKHKPDIIWPNLYRYIYIYIKYTHKNINNNITNLP